MSDSNIVCIFNLNALFKLLPQVLLFRLQSWASKCFDMIVSIIWCLFLCRFGETAKPVDNVHAPDFSSNRCGSFMHPYIEYHSYGEYIDQTELQESLIVRYDDWSNSKFPQWTSSANENYVKYFINDKVSTTSYLFTVISFTFYCSSFVIASIC